MNKEKRNKGITLIALIITVIVLLILAGVSINMVIGENGLIKKAQGAVEIANKASALEQIEMYKSLSYYDNQNLEEILIESNMIDKNELDSTGITKFNGSDYYLVLKGQLGLKTLAENVNSGNNYEGKTIYLLNDIKCDVEFNKETGELIKGDAHIIIGDSDIADGGEKIYHEFNGTFDGLNHTIEKLYIKEDKDRVGVFGTVGENGVIENVIIKNSYIKGMWETGGIVGSSKGTLRNCENYSDILGDQLTGGIAGRNKGTIDKCTNHGNILVSGNQVGGIVANCDFGENIIVSNCKNYGDIVSNSNTVGGIIGGAFRGNAEITNVNVTISKCQNFGTITSNGEKGKVVGGIVGHSSATIENCINEGDVFGYQSVGGIAGITVYLNSKEANVYSSKNYGEIHGKLQHVGGIVGYACGKIIECSNHSDVYLEGNAAYYGVGGIAGINFSSLTDMYIEKCYNTGTITLDNSNGKAHQIAGIVGHMSGNASNSFNGYIIDCYNTGTIKCINYNSGDIPAGIVSYTQKIVIKNCYNIGKIITSPVNSGGHGILRSNPNERYCKYRK